MPVPMNPAEIAEADRRFADGEEVWMWCLHHEQHFERLTEPLSNRIRYVKLHKSDEEIPVRLREIQVVKNPAALKALIPAYDAARAEAQKAYYAAMAEAQKAYDAARAEPQKAYYAARAEPQKAYYAAMAEAQKAYDAAMAEAQKAYDAAMAEPQKAYYAAMAEADLPILALHRSEYPDTCWTGLSIFAKE